MADVLVFVALVVVVVVTGAVVVVVGVACDVEDVPDPSNCCAASKS